MICCCFQLNAEKRCGFFVLREDLHVLAVLVQTHLSQELPKISVGHRTGMIVDSVLNWIWE